MPLRQIARTPKAPTPARYRDDAYAFAVEIRRVPNPTADYETVVVRCPWCAEEEVVHMRADAPECPTWGRGYAVVIPAGTPVLA